MHKDKVVLLDGGMGQELLQRSAKAPTPLWSAQFLLDDPALVEAIHLDFIKAGSSAITINAYSATPERLARDGNVSLFEELQELAMSLAGSARRKSQEDITITGCLPPLFGSYHPEIAPPFEECLTAYRRLVAVQKDGVDVFLCETMASLKEARACLQAARESGKPVWLSLTVDDDDGLKLRSGERLKDVLPILEEDQPNAILLNCSKPEAITTALPLLQELKVPFGAYANGFQSITALNIGGTVKDLERRADLGPEVYANEAMKWVAAGASILGGCCEITPDHIRALHQRLTDAGIQIVRNVVE